MKAVYLIWPDVDYIEELIKAGIDTLIVANLDQVNDINPVNFWGSYQDTMEIIERYQNDPRVTVIFMPVWVRYWEDLPQWQQYYDGDIFHPRTPCPTSEEFVESRLVWFKFITNQYNVELAVDTENYGELLSLYTKGWFRRRKCKCSDCKDKSTREQYKIHQKMIRDRTSDLKFVGQTPYSKWWVSKLFHKNAWYFDQGTYDGIKFKHKWKAFWRGFFTGTRTIAGIWCERMTPEEIVEQVKIANKSWVFDGYWLYPHARFSRHSWVRKPAYHDGSIDPYYLNLIDVDDPQFFARLGEAN